MRIVLGADQYPEYVNGAANFTSRLAAGLAGRGHVVDLLWPSAQGTRRSSVEDGVRIHRLTALSLPGRPRMQVCLPRTARREIDLIMQVARPDVVHVQSHLGLGRSLLAAARAEAVPVMATNHFMPENLVHHLPGIRLFPELAARLAWRDLERVFGHADLVSAPTPRAVELLATSTRLTPARAISCGLDLDAYRPEHGRDELPPTILFVGRLEHEKHVDELVAAFAGLPPQCGARLEIVGMGSLRAQLEQQVAGLGLDDCVTFLGAVTDQELRAAYRRATLFVMPGTAELQSLATLEAMAAGLPVVAADAMALPHLVGPDNGFLFGPGDVTGLRQRIAALVLDPVLAGRLGRASSVKAEAHSLGATLTAFEQCYAQILGHAPAPADSGSAQPVRAMMV